VVHNVYLQMLVEVGIVGLALFLIVVANSLAASMRAARRFERREDYESAALGRAVFVGLIAALVASFFISNGSGFQIWVLLALGPLLLRNAEAQDEPAPARAPTPALARGRLTRRPPAWQA
jgi:O-antigen ligase